MPVWNNFFGLLLFIIGIIFWAFILYRFSGENIDKSQLIIFSCILVSFPYLAKMIIFTGNLVTLGYIYIFSALSILFLFMEKNKYFSYIISIICLSITLMFDKAYIVLFFQGICIVFLLNTSLQKKLYEIKFFIKFLIYICLHVLISLIMYIACTKYIQLWLNIIPNNYTNNYFQYDFANMLSSIKIFIINFFKISLFRVTTSAGLIFLISNFIFLVLEIYISLKNKKILNFIIAIGFIFITNLVFFITGNIYMPQRTFCYSYALFVAAIFVLLYKHIKFNRILNTIIIVFSFIIVFYQSKEMTTIFYNAHITYKQDENKMNLLVNDIYKLVGSNNKKPIIFMGNPNEWHYSYGEREETSIFVWDRLASENSEETSNRLYEFINMQGYNINKPSRDVDFTQIREELFNMNSWPMENSINVYDEYIIIKLGDSNCEIYNGSLEECLFTIDGKQIEVPYNIDYCNDDLNNFSISGWIALLEGNPVNSNYSLLLSSENKQYKLRLEEVERKDVTQYLNNGYNYDYSGFSGNCTSQYIEKGKYNLYILIESEDNNYILNINKTLVYN